MAWLSVIEKRIKCIIFDHRWFFNTFSNTAWNGKKVRKYNFVQNATKNMINNNTGGEKNIGFGSGIPMSTKKETTFCTHKGYNTVAPCDDSCFSTKKEKCNGTKAEWLLEFENMVKDNSFVTPSSHLNVLAIQDFISKAITTALAKRELEIADELRDLPGRTVSIGRVLQIIQH